MLNIHVRQPQMILSSKYQTASRRISQRNPNHLNPLVIDGKLVGLHLTHIRECSILRLIFLKDKFVFVCQFS